MSLEQLTFALRNVFLGGQRSPVCNNMSCYRGSPIPKSSSHETAKTIMFYIRVIVKIENKLKTNWIDVWGYESRNDNPITLWKQQIPGIKIIMIFCSSLNERQHRDYKDRYILNMATLLLYIICIDIEENKINTVKIQQKT